MATGKIARIPRHIRNKLSQRLDDGEGGESLLEWLNGLPEVKELCDEEFDSVPVSKQNLSDFKQGPHQEWLRGRKPATWRSTLPNKPTIWAAPRKR